MSYQTQYIHLPDDKSEHIIGDGQRTECGVPIPYGSDWTTEPDGSVCSACKKNAGKADEAQEAPVAAGVRALREAKSGDKA